MASDASVMDHTKQVDASHVHDFLRAAISHCMEIDDTFRRNLRAKREAAGLGVDQLSLKVGTNRRLVRDIEEGRSQSPKISTVFALAEALGCDPGELLGLGPRVELRAELATFLRGLDAEGQARLLTALEAFRGLSGE